MIHDVEKRPYIGRRLKSTMGSVLKVIRLLSEFFHWTSLSSSWRGIEGFSGGFVRL